MVLQDCKIGTVYVCEGAGVTSGRGRGMKEIKVKEYR
jgi:hypothetical protein